MSHSHHSRPACRSYSVDPSCVLTLENVFRAAEFTGFASPSPALCFPSSDVQCHTVFALSRRAVSSSLSLKLCFCSSSPLISDQIGSALLPLLSSVCEFVCNWVVVCGSVAFSPPVHAGLFVYGACLYGASVFYTNQS